METTGNVTLASKVAKFKVIARDALRMNLINPRLTRIANEENRISNINKDIKNTNHALLVEKYEISKMDSDHPNHANRLAGKEARIKTLTEAIESYNKNIEEFNKSIVEQNKEITAIESGETKVSLDDLNDLTNKLIKQDALNQVTI
jgi:peptidoglycan hydrolase CwlO-like protein